MQYKLNIRSIEYNNKWNGISFSKFYNNYSAYLNYTNILNPLATKKKKIKDFKIFLLTKVYPEFR